MDSSLGKDYQITTLPETNIAPENRRSQKDTSIPNSNHPLFMFHVSFREGKYYWKQIPISLGMRAFLRMRSYHDKDMTEISKQPKHTKKVLLYIYIWVFPKIVVPPNHPF